MRWKIVFVAASLAGIALAGGPRHPLTLSTAQAACPGERIDASTAADATRKLQAHGYRQVRGLKKGCDNYWYGYANKDGREQHISLSPGGEIQLQHE